MPHSLEQGIGYYHTRCRQLPYSRPILARGWDCHGLPPELEAETQLGINHKNEVEAMGVGTFNDACRASVPRPKLSRRVMPNGR